MDMAFGVLYEPGTTERDDMADCSEWSHGGVVYKGIRSSSSSIFETGMREGALLGVAMSECRGIVFLGESSGVKKQMLGESVLKYHKLCRLDDSTTWLLLLWFQSHHFFEVIAL